MRRLAQACEQSGELTMNVGTKHSINAKLEEQTQVDAVMQIGEESDDAAGSDIQNDASMLTLDERSSVCVSSSEPSDLSDVSCT